ncbi:MAG: HAD family hydrolase [Deltaproteobacteria bacterium]|nr:HAD family hydrolase [Deltaproteobacteria bacterium]
MSQLVSAVFIDRDGTINHDCGYLSRFSDFSWIEGAPQALARLKTAGLKLAIVTNQSGVAKGYYNLEAVKLLHQQINQDLKAKTGTIIDGWYYCPHHPDIAPCRCRKPAPGLLTRAANELGLDLLTSYMVGDKSIDVLAGQAAEVKLSILVRTGYGLEDQFKISPEIPVVDDLNAAANLIINDLNQK